MPDLQKLYSFLDRTNKHLQFALQNGDKAGVDMYEQMLDRANRVGERALKVSGHMPESVDNQQPMPFGDQPATPAPPKNPYAGAEFATGPEGDGTPPQQSAQVGGLPQINTSGKPAGNSLVDLKSLNGSDKLIMDLDQEVKPVTSPFQKPQGTMDKLINKFPSVSSNLEPSASTELEHTNYKDIVSGPRRSVVGNTAPEELPYGFSVGNIPSQEPKGYFSLVPGNEDFLRLVDNPKYKSEEVNAPPSKPDVDQTKPGMQSTADVASPEQTIGGEPEQMPSRYDIDPSFRAKWDSVTGMSAEDQAKHAAEFDRNKEFERRVEQEYGKKPSFIEGLLMTLVGGMRGLDAYREKNAAYMHGRASTGREMRGEVMAGRKMDYQQKKDSLNRELEQRKAMSVLLPKAIRDQQEPVLQKARALSGQIQAIERSINPDPQRIQQIQAEMEALIQEADRIATTGYGRVGMNVPKPAKE